MFCPRIVASLQCAVVFNQLHYFDGFREGQSSAAKPIKPKKVLIFNFKGKFGCQKTLGKGTKKFCGYYSKMLV